MGKRGGFTWLGAVAGHRAAGVGSSISRSRVQRVQRLQQLQHGVGFWKEKGGYSPTGTPHVLGQLPKCICSLQRAPMVGGLCPRGDLSSHEALSLAGRRPDPEHVNTFHTSA